MSSGKQSKRARRAAEVAPPVQQRTASPQVLLIALAVTGVAALVAALGLALSHRSAGTPSEAAALAGAAEVQEMLVGIPQRGNVLGARTAAVRIVEYVDLQCPYCREFEVGALPAIVERYVRPGKASLELRTLAFIGPDSERGRNAALAAGRQNKLFNLVQVLYANQGAENSGWLSDDLVRAAAASVAGLDVPQLLDELDSVGDEAASLDAQAQAGGIQSTPTILVDGRKVELASAADADAVARAIDAALR